MDESIPKPKSIRAVVTRFYDWPVPGDMLYDEALRRAKDIERIFERGESGELPPFGHHAPTQINVFVTFRVEEE